MHMLYIHATGQTTFRRDIIIFRVLSFMAVDPTLIMVYVKQLQESETVEFQVCIQIYTRLNISIHKRVVIL